MNNPFDLKNYKPQVSFDDLEKARKSAYQMTQHINKQRKQGIEPSKSYGSRVSGVPQDYTMDMPDMPMHKRSLNRKARKQS
jgi:hypothetical protein